MNARLPITLCVGTRNAGDFLDGCIASCADWVTEIVIIDMESEDDTVAVAKRYGARVLQVPNAGFVEAGRQRGIESATQPWILILDADERAPQGLPRLLEMCIRRPGVSGLYLPRRNYLFGRWIRHSGYWPGYQMRFFRREAMNWPAIVHIRPSITGRAMFAPADPELAIEHWNYSTIREWIARNNRYTDIQADELVKLRRSPRVARWLTRPIRRFLQTYVRHKGVLDGRHGLAIALLLAVNELAVELKLWDRQNDSGRTRIATTVDRR